MFKLIVVLVFGTLLQLLNAVSVEQKLLDSLKTAQGENLYKMSERYYWSYSDQEPQKAITVLEKTLKEAELLNNNFIQATVLHRIAICYEILGKSDIAFSYEKKCYALASGKNYAELLIKSSLNIGKYYLRKKDITNSSSFLDYAEKKSRVLTDKKMLVNVLEQQANLARQKHDLDAEIGKYQEAIEICVQQKNEADIAFFTSSLGMTYLGNNRFQEALEQILISSKIYQRIGSDSDKAKIYSILGNTYLQNNDYEKSLEYLLKSLELRKKTGSTIQIAKTLIGLGQFYLKLERYDKAIAYFQEAYKLVQNSENTEDITPILTSLGVTYRQMGNYAKSLESHQKALTLFRRVNDIKGVAMTLNNIGVAYMESKDYNKSLNYYLQSYMIKKELKENTSIASSLVNLADIYVKLNDPTKAAETLAELDKLVDSVENPAIKASIFATKADVAKMKNDYPRAYKYLKEYQELNESILKDKYNQNLTKMEIKYGMAVKEKQIEILKKNQELQRSNLSKSKTIRNYLIIILFLSLSVISVLYWRFKGLKKYNLLLSEKEMKLEKWNQTLEQRVDEEVAIRRENEIKAFRQARLASLGEIAAGIAHELNQPLHSLAFTLDNVLLAIESKEADQHYISQKLDYIFEDISRMREIIDHVRHFSRQSTDVPLKEIQLNETVKQAVSLIEKQYSKMGIKIETDFSPNLPGIIANPYKLEQVILNLLSNAKDALKDKGKSSAMTPIMLKTYSNEDGIVLEVTDQGIGMSEEVLQKAFQVFYTTKDAESGTGLGLTIIQGIIQEFGGSIQLQSEPGKYTTAKVIIPLTNLKEDV